jgi:hypothetical protein
MRPISFNKNGVRFAGSGGGDICWRLHNTGGRYACSTGYVAWDCCQFASAICDNISSLPAASGVRNHPVAAIPEILK